ncbi:MAG TPA: hypothetical protein VFF39_18845 [Verrucomicrobiae bacterium]|nr:hypothetical protein [Verrucomicrobiae bacterium]
MAATSPAQANIYFTHKTRIAVCILCAGLILALPGCAGGRGVFGGGVDFSLAVAPGSQTVAAGSSIGYAITINQKSGLGPLVQLSVSGLPPGATAGFGGESISGPGTANLVILTAINTPTGTFHLTITGSDFSGTQATEAMMTVTPGPPLLDFIVSVTPASRTTLGGGVVDYKVSVTSDNAAPVNLSVSGLPAGATGIFNPASITHQGTSTLTVTTQDPTAPGFYGLNVIGTDPTGTQKVPIILNIPSVDFTLQQQIGPFTVMAGGNAIGTVTATPVLGALQSVSLSVVSGLPPGASASFSPATLGGPVTSSTLTVTTTTSLMPGLYQLVVQGTDASGIQTVQVPFQVISGNPSAGFFLAAVPDEHEVQPGGSASYTIIVSNNAGPVPPVTFTLTGGPLNGSMGITPLGNNAFLLSVSTDPLDNERITSVLITATGPNGTQQIEVSLQIDQIPIIAKGGL